MAKLPKKKNSIVPKQGGMMREVQIPKRSRRQCSPLFVDRSNLCRSHVRSSREKEKVYTTRRCKICAAVQNIDKTAESARKTNNHHDPVRAKGGMLVSPLLPASFSIPSFQHYSLTTLPQYPKAGGGMSHIMIKGKLLSGR